ncbi:DUF5672 family protein [Croceibacterium ferulae]|uniref:DUF5672 family protein n=1 Tax=Croceibacterium ferulae TaxID=1854641 RepID=UPI000EAB90EF|nr:DUF5672 family protein [Croceibacterium ferulae]
MTQRLDLGNVSLCAAASVNVAATLRALVRCMQVADFGEVLLFTDAPDLAVPAGIRVVEIDRLTSSQAYSAFMLRDLPQWVRLDHCLVVQWDGFILDPAAWDPAFLVFDYIGAPWPQFGDGHDVGNGGFSLRSRRLLQACSHIMPGPREPEDVAICRSARPYLEESHGIRFADAATASRFAFERDRRAARAFGFHGVFNLVEAVGVDEFWEIYRELDDRRTVWVDFRLILKTYLRSGGRWGRAFRIVRDRCTGR